MPPTPDGPPSFWQVEFELPRHALGGFEAAIEPLCVSTSCFEQDEAADIWTFQALFETKPDPSLLAAPIGLAAQIAGVPEPEVRISYLAGRDWLAASKIAFPPISAGRFFIHGSHFEGTPPPGSHPLKLDAATAFGSGDHESTRGCLLAIDALARRGFLPTRILDVGCGSGILSLAAAKAFGQPVLGVDIDPESVRVARGNVQTNGLGSYVRIEPGDGVKGREIHRGAPYDLIVANILARPLCSMSASISRLSAPFGRVVLAGLLKRQAPLVQEAYRRNGLRLERRIELGAWATLVLKRGRHS